MGAGQQETTAQTSQDSATMVEPAGGSERPQNKLAAPIYCVVPGCATDVSGGPHYLRRHKICQFHLKAKSVTLEDREVRFCQQCGRFQPLCDFKEGQRSCEAALQAHNARRRVKKDANGNAWSAARKGRGSKRALAACPADDPSSSEDGAVGASRKSAQPRRGSQRSAPSNLQRSQAQGSDSFGKATGSEGNERPLSDGARTVEQHAWTSHASPDNSYGSPDACEQQQLQLQLPAGMLPGVYCTGGSNTGSPAAADLNEQQLLMPDGSFCQAGFGAAGPSRLGLQVGAGAVGSQAEYGMPACCGAWASGLLEQQGQGLDLSLGSLGMPSISQAPQMLCEPAMHGGLSTAAGFGGGGGFCQAGTLEDWVMPQSVLQQQQAVLQQYWSPPGGCSSGLEEAMGQSLMLQQAMQEQQKQQHQQQQLMMMSQPQLQQQQAGVQLPLHVQQRAGSGVKVSTGLGTELSGSNLTAQDPPVPSAEPSSAATAAPADAGPPPVTSAAAAAALASDPVFGSLPMQGANSSSSLSLLDALEAGAAAAPAVSAAMGSGGPGQPNEDTLLEEVLEVLLAGGPDLQLDDILMVGPQAAAAARSGTHSQMVPPATTSSPSSSNVNGGNNLSGPLSVPSLPSASASQAAGAAPGAPLLSGAQAQQACGMAAAAAAAGLIHATDALHVGSPGKAPGSILPAAAHAQAGSMLAAGGGVAASVGLDDLLPPVQPFGPMGGVDAAVSLPPAAASSLGVMAGGGAGVMGPLGPAAVFSTGMPHMGGLAPATSTAAGMFPASGGAGMFGAGTGGLLGGAASFGGMHPATAGGAMPGAMPAGPHAGGVLGGMSGAAGSVMAMGGMAATGPMALAASGSMALQQGCPQMDPGFSSMQGPSLQAMWHQQQQQQDKHSLLLQQQLMMQQQQQAEYLRLQQQQQMQHRQQLMRLQQQVNSTMTYTQQLARLSIKLHGVTPDQLPASTVLAMERLLVNNAADIEMILLQPSLRQGCIQFELDVLVKCPQPSARPTKGGAAHAAPAAAAAAGEGAEGCGAEPAAAAGFAAAPEEACESGAGPKLQQGMGYSGLAAVVAAFHNTAATQAEGLLREALPFRQLVQALLSLPLVAGEAAAPDSDSDAGSDLPGSSEDASSDYSSSDASSSVSDDSGSSLSSSQGACLRDCVQAIYAQVGDCLGIWRADSGVVQEWSTDLSADFTFVGASSTSGSSNWRPAIKACMPMVSAVSESSAASSPTAAAAAGQTQALKPLPLQLALQAAAAGAGSGSSADGAQLQLWCTRRGQFLPVATRHAPAGAAAHSPQGLQVVTGLLDSTPGMLLLQAEQLVQLQRAAGAGDSSSTADLEWGELGCMSGLVPVLLCPSAAMAAECNVLLQMADNPSSIAPKVLHLGLLLDFWAMHQQLQQQQLVGGPRLQWQEALLGDVRYLKAIKSIGTQLLLSAVVSGMSATSAHLHAIMSVVRELHAQHSAAAAGPAMHAAPAQAPAPAAQAAAGASEGLAAGAGNSQGHSEVQQQEEEEQEGCSGTAAAGLKPVQEWVFEEVDCKASKASERAGSSSSSAASDGRKLPSFSGKSRSRPGRGASAAEVAAAVEAEGQQSPYAIFRGATQMLLMLLVMYLLLEVAAAVYKGRSPGQLLLVSLSQLKELLGIMLVPLAMMCLGGVLAVWQFGLGGSGNQADPQQQGPQRAGSLGGDSGSSKAGKPAELAAEGVACG